MKQTITKNPENLEILYKLVANGFYQGSVEATKFELVGKHSTNYRILGRLNGEGKFVVKAEPKFSHNISQKIMLALGISACIILLVKRNWIIPLLIAIMGLASLATTRSKKKRELDRFMDRFLDFVQKEASKISLN
ncbi:hypothetical protein [Flagellimonas algicola]|uniref:Uncharacterized protein n=1 Tax=Flagellimonas algicola TaxID=2583815 RepID=A0ABY2WRJ2_9FLAO|nr:hypothetical protein [Allomuricauda algicola]TMU57633.1 hypothetical protein FGG15_08815 [Allomuricauda algicola]